MQALRDQLQEAREHEDQRVRDEFASQRERALRQVRIDFEEQMRRTEELLRVEHENEHAKEMAELSRQLQVEREAKIAESAQHMTHIKHEALRNLQAAMARDAEAQETELDMEHKTRLDSALESLKHDLLDQNAATTERLGLVLEQAMADARVEFRRVLSLDEVNVNDESSDGGMGIRRTEKEVGIRRRMRARSRGGGEEDDLVDSGEVVLDEDGERVLKVPAVGDPRLEEFLQTVGRSHHQLHKRLSSTTQRLASTAQALMAARRDALAAQQRLANRFVRERACEEKQHQHQQQHEGERDPRHALRQFMLATKPRAGSLGESSSGSSTTMFGSTMSSTATAAAALRRIGDI
jgi:hypothetical protein